MSFNHYLALKYKENLFFQKYIFLQFFHFLKPKFVLEQEFQDFLQKYLFSFYQDKGNESQTKKKLFLSQEFTKKQKSFFNFKNFSKSSGNNIISEFFGQNFLKKFALLIETSLSVEVPPVKIIVFIVFIFMIILIILLFFIFL